MDLYSHNAEWYAALVADHDRSLRPVVERLLGALPGGDVVELGAGIGTLLPTLRALGADRIHAVEPSPAMRVGLMTTVAADPRLRASTTILPGTLDQHLHRLPQRWSGAVMLNAIGHLGDGERERLWRTLAERLQPAARFVLSLQPPERPMSLPWTAFGEVAVGAHTLSTRGCAEPDGDRHVSWTMEWSLLDAEGAVLDRRTGLSRWRTLSTADVRTEAAAAGLDLLEQDTAMSVLALGRG